ncbi:MAG: DEAD/DEAH box helicase family protein [Nonlabens sp.]|nr:DEAD/DEAH box helicase family protein [Nonlabens sp.]
MNQFPSNAAFIFPWRAYQQRVLDAMPHYLRDGNLHVIAPPGSGKTILGLEAALRLNKPTLILAPTLTIRNQWIDRFCTLFLNTVETPTWISTDVRKPAFLTVITYQGLHAACSTNFGIDTSEINEDEDEAEIPIHEKKASTSKLNEIASLLSAQNVQTIVVDEMHHLRNEWWRTLNTIKSKLDPTIVGLTATPPYDVSAQEWARYTALSGAVDIEISVPELVAAGDLCPHQDYVYLSLPTEVEQANLEKLNKALEALFTDLKNDVMLLAYVKSHKAIITAQEHTDWIYANIDVYASFLIYLHANHVRITDEHLDILGDKNVTIPLLDRGWLTVLLQFYLFESKKETMLDEHQKLMLHTLRRNGVLEHSTINFNHHVAVASTLNASIGKLDSILEIARFENAQLGSALRMVILTDYIRKEYLVNSGTNDVRLTKFGVISIFEKLSSYNTNDKLGVLTGTVVIVPVPVFKILQERFTESTQLELNGQPLSYDADYIHVTVNGTSRQLMVHLVTALFEEGHIHILTGTKALLGEGWDSPAVNTLILASFVGSFVQSNQMRGRAIRVQQGNKGKASAIWHLACVDLSCKDGGEDVNLLRRRFKSFVGISCARNKQIENGISRMQLPEIITQSEQVAGYNRVSLDNASSRENLSKKWTSSLKQGVALVEEIHMPFANDSSYSAVMTSNLKKSVSSAFAAISLGFTTFLSDVFITVIQRGFGFSTLMQIQGFVMLFGGMGLLFFSGLTIKYTHTYLKFKHLQRNFHNIALVMVKSLIRAQVIQTNVDHIKINTVTDADGTISCHLTACTNYEKSVFLDAMQVMLSPIETPRYILKSKQGIFGVNLQTDYYSIPDSIAKNKTLARYFLERWKEHVGGCELIFTRSIQGRKILIQSRLSAVTAILQNKVTRSNIWR